MVGGWGGLGGETILRNENGDEGTGKLNIRTRNTLLATDEACVAIYSNLPKALREGHLSALGSQ